MKTASAPNVAQARMVKVSVIIPAFNEEAYLEETLTALRPLGFVHELIVVDDGSSDRTAEIASRYADRVIRHEKNKGKGAALQTGWQQARGDVFLFLDADLGKTVRHSESLLEPIVTEAADMAVAILPPAERKGGFGLVKKLASWGIYGLTGFRPQAPLSGQRAVRREVMERLSPLPQGFGIEVGMTIDLLRAGYRIVEVKIPFSHRETGRDLSGFWHRGKQLLAVGQTLREKWAGSLWRP
ncbi:glycosyltransferase family 2 protein [Bacillaceae bacterium]